MDEEELQAVKVMDQTVPQAEQHVYLLQRMFALFTCHSDVFHCQKQIIYIHALYIYIYIYILYFRNIF